MKGLGLGQAHSRARIWGLEPREPHSLSLLPCPPLTEHLLCAFHTFLT